MATNAQLLTCFLTLPVLLCVYSISTLKFNHHYYVFRVMLPWIYCSVIMCLLYCYFKLIKILLCAQNTVTSICCTDSIVLFFIYRLVWIVCYYVFNILLCSIYCTVIVYLVYYYFDFITLLLLCSTYFYFKLTALCFMFLAYCYFELIILLICV